METGSRTSRPAPADSRTSSPSLRPVARRGRSVSLPTAMRTACRGRPTERSCSSTPSQRTEDGTARARRSDPADAAIPRRPVPRSVQRGERHRRPSPPPAEPTPTAPAADRRQRASKPATRPKPEPVDIVFDDIRQRATVIPPASMSARRSSVRTGRPSCMIAGAAGQQNLYAWSLDELARERPVAKQLTATPGDKARCLLHAGQQGSLLPRRGPDPGRWRSTSANRDRLP